MDSFELSLRKLRGLPRETVGLSPVPKIPAVPAGAANDRLVVWLHVATSRLPELLYRQRRDVMWEAICAHLRT